MGTLAKYAAVLTFLTQLGAKAPQVVGIVKQMVSLGLQLFGLLGIPTEGGDSLTGYDIGTPSPGPGTLGLVQDRNQSDDVQPEVVEALEVKVISLVCEPQVVEGQPIVAQPLIQKGGLIAILRAAKDLGLLHWLLMLIPANVVQSVQVTACHSKHDGISEQKNADDKSY